MIKIPLHSNKKLLLAFEFGLVMAKVAQEQKVELTQELSERAEEIILNEFQRKGSEKLALEMHQNILAVFEPKLDV
jgi:hypothetical protein